MPTPQESHALAPAAARHPPRKMLQLLRKRIRQLLRITSGLAICLALAAAALEIWWLTSLNGLPDIGEPFDVAAFRAFSVPDDQNAFTFLRRAREKLTPFPGLARGARTAALLVASSKADPNVREWVEANRPALELFQLAGDQSDGIAHPADEPISFLDTTDLTWLALLEAGRRAESGNMAGAWDCYRAVLRMANHIRRRGSVDEIWVVRYELGLSDGMVRQMLETWAADPRTTIPQLRNALEELLKNEPKPEWYAFSLKFKYLEMMRNLEQPIHPFTQQDLEEEYCYRLGDMRIPADLAGAIYAARRSLLREPERSRRVLRLLVANWLAQVETLGPPPRKPAARASFSLLTATNPIMKSSFNVPLYPAGPDAPAGARPLPPREVASWLVTTNDAKLLISGWPWPSERHQGRNANTALVIMLASEIFHRERGSLPPSEEALIGTYLKSLPDDGSAELDDGTAPTVQ